MLGFLVTTLGCGAALSLPDVSGGRSREWEGEGWGRPVIDLGRSVISN